MANIEMVVRRWLVDRDERMDAGVSTDQLENVDDTGRRLT